LVFTFNRILLNPEIWLRLRLEAAAVVTVVAVAMEAVAAVGAVSAAVLAVVLDRWSLLSLVHVPRDLGITSGSYYFI
jgi:hypothetical protein